MSPPQENPLAKALAMTSASIFMLGSPSCQLESSLWAEMSGPPASAPSESRRRLRCLTSILSRSLGALSARLKSATLRTSAGLRARPLVGGSSGRRPEGEGPRAGSAQAARGSKVREDPKDLLRCGPLDRRGRTGGFRRETHGRGSRSNRPR
jgi:hypothetical protein